jgi:hypothetical protein
MSTEISFEQSEVIYAFLVETNIQNVTHIVAINFIFTAKKSVSSF